MPVSNPPGSTSPLALWRAVCVAHAWEAPSVVGAATNLLPKQPPKQLLVKRRRRPWGACRYRVFGKVEAQTASRSWSSKSMPTSQAPQTPRASTSRTCSFAEGREAVSAPDGPAAPEAPGGSEVSAPGGTEVSAPDGRAGTEACCLGALSTSALELCADSGACTSVGARGVEGKCRWHSLSASKNRIWHVSSQMYSGGRSRIPDRRPGGIWMCS